MAAVESSGTQSATINTEHTLASPSTIKTRVLIVDLAALVNGERVELRVKMPVLSGGTVREVYKTTFENVQGDPIVESPPVVMPQGGSFTLKQVAGTSRSFPWAIVTLD